MQVIYLGLVGVIGGIIGGMGMGGGTLLIPLLCIFFSVGQKTAQAINLVAFIPMAILALIIHLKNKLIVKEYSVLLISGGIVGALVGNLLATVISTNIISKIFAIFIILIGLRELLAKPKIKG